MRIAFIIGRVVRDATLTKMKDREFLNFTVATNDIHTMRNGEKKMITCFFSCTTNKLSHERHLVKGRLLAIRGKLLTTSYVSKNGTHYEKAYISCEEIQYLSIGSKVQERLDAEAEKMKEIQKDIESQSELFAMNGIRPTELPELADFDIVDTDAPF